MISGAVTPVGGGRCGGPDAATLVEAKGLGADVPCPARHASGRPVVGGRRRAALSEVGVVGSAVLKQFSATFAVHSEDGDIVHSPQRTGSWPW